MVALINRHASLQATLFCSPGQTQMCLIQFSLEKMIEKLLPGYQPEEWGRPLQVTVLELGKRFCRGIFLVLEKLEAPLLLTRNEGSTSLEGEGECPEVTQLHRQFLGLLLVCKNASFI